MGSEELRGIYERNKTKTKPGKLTREKEEGKKSDPRTNDDRKKLVLKRLDEKQWQRK